MDDLPIKEADVMKGKLNRMSHSKMIKLIKISLTPLIRKVLRTLDVLIATNLDIHLVLIDLQL